MTLIDAHTRRIELLRWALSKYAEVEMYAV